MSQKKNRAEEHRCTSEWSTKAAAHPNSTANRQDVCVTVRILLIQRGKGVSMETILETIDMQNR